MPMTPLPTLSEIDLSRLAAAWRDVDPCVTYQDAVAAAIKTGDGAVGELFGTHLQFGTAGLRGQLGPGPGAMNRVLVRTVAHALGRFVLGDGGTHVVIGYDARRQSDVFALDTARVLAAMGITATLIDQPSPTPVLAFAVRHLGADAGVMVTASHNPRTDNGYKVYGSDGALLAAPNDEALAQLVGTTPLVQTSDLADETHTRIVRTGDDLIDAYVAAATSVLRTDASHAIRVAYTPLHGVGYQVLARSFAAAGFPDPIPVADQQEPDGDFPTTPFPNPEEPGVLDHLFATATAAGVDLALANDPDADRLAVAVQRAGSWRLLTGDEVGSLIAEYLLSSLDDGARPRLVVNTVVSSQLLAKIAAHHHTEHEQTLTGFKWIMRAQSTRNDADFVMGYEEALGYAVGTAIRDKDGISAALVIAELAGELAGQGRTLLDALDDLQLRHGAHVTGQRSLRFESSGPTPTQVMRWLRSDPPMVLAGHSVIQVEDLLDEGGALPPTDAVVLHLECGRLIIRPSGTEPKLKLYGECWRPAPASPAELHADRAGAHQQLTSALDALGSLVGDPERADTRTLFATSAPESDDTIEARAAELFATVPTQITREEALRLSIASIDLTTLTGDDTYGRVRALCAQARRPDPADATVGPTAAVCVYPNLVLLAAELTKGSGVAVASVAGAFPSGLSSLEVRLSDIAEAVCAGADEIDVVLNRAAFLAGDHQLVADELKAMRQQIGPRVMKVILETSELESPTAIRTASKLAIHAGADWIKTSTGKAKAGATPVAVLAMAEAIAEHSTQGGTPVGLKISGGVGTSADALGYLAILEATLGPTWLQPDRVRFGASGLLTALVADLAAMRG